MTPEQKQLNLLGLALRSGNLVTGDEMVEKGIKRGKVSYVLVANDASEATKKRYEGFSERYPITVNFTFSRVQLSDAIGKSRSVIALSNQGMIKRFKSY